MKLVMVGSESNPFIKTGGLADVVYALGRQMAKTGEEVSIFIPLYSGVKGKLKKYEKNC